MFGLAEKVELRKRSQIVYRHIADFHNVSSAYGNRKRFLFKSFTLTQRTVGSTHITFYVPLYAFGRSLVVPALSIGDKTFPRRLITARKAVGVILKVNFLTAVAVHKHFVNFFRQFFYGNVKRKTVDLGQ